MITKFKIYNSFNEGEPEVGDYVICTTKYSPDLNLYLSNQIGKIIGIDNENNRVEPYQVHFINVPDSLRKYKNVRDYKYSNTIPFSRFEIINWSKSKEELKNIFDTNKFNI